MVYGGAGSNVCKMKCEKCKQRFILADLIIIYGPDKYVDVYGAYTQKPHHYCRECHNETN